jgi:hypothetical protein
MGGCVGGWVGGWVGGLMCGCVCGWMGGWVRLVVSAGMGWVGVGSGAVRWGESMSGRVAEKRFRGEAESEERTKTKHGSFVRVSVGPT